MKNTFKFFGIIALTAVFILAFTACSNSSNGTGGGGGGGGGGGSTGITSANLIIDGLGSYEGRYVFALGESKDLFLMAANNINAASLTIWGGKVSGGVAALKVWEGADDNSLIGYAGSDKVDFEVFILNKEQITVTLDSSGGIDPASLLGVVVDNFYIYGVTFLLGQAAASK